MKTVENLDLKLDIYNFINNSDKEKEEIAFLYYNKETGEVISGLTESYMNLIAVFTDLEELQSKEKYRGFILNAAINIIKEFPEDYLETMTNFIESQKK